MADGNTLLVLVVAAKFYVTINFSNDPRGPSVTTSNTNSATLADHR
jgi:hypothetical protein